MADDRKDIRTRRVEKVVEEITPPDTINQRIQSLIDAYIVYNGQVTGKRYEWVGAGAIAEVDERDVPELLAKRRGKKPCCGEQERPKIFQLAK